MHQDYCIRLQFTNKTHRRNVFQFNLASLNLKGKLLSHQLNHLQAYYIMQMESNNQQNHLQVASVHFQNGNTQQSIIVYTKIIEGQLKVSQQIQLQALLNRASAYYTECEYELSMRDAQKYITYTKQNEQQQKPDSFVIYCNCLIKMKKLLSQKEREIVQQGKKLFPYHKKLNQVKKTLDQIQISQNEDEYMDKMFQKLLMHPKIREYLTDESFLTKVQKLIRNPSLASALVKIDKRLQEVSEALLMAEQ